MAVISANRSNTIEFTQREGCDKRKRHSGSRKRNRFLTTRFDSIPGYLIAGNTAIACVKQDDCISRLRTSVEHFYREFGMDFRLPALTGNFKYDLKELYNYLSEHLPENDMSIECVKDVKDSDDFRFVVYKSVNKFDYYTIWTVPIHKLSTCDEQTRELLLHTFAMLHREDMFLFPKESYDFEYSLGQLENDSWGKEKLEVDMDALEQWDDDYRDYASSYVQGDIYHLFEEIHSVEMQNKGSLSSKVLELVRQMKESNYNDICLLVAIEDVANLCKEKWIADFHISKLKEIYGDDFDNGNQEPYEIMDFCRTFIFCYKQDDPIVEYLIDAINSYADDFQVGNLMVHSYIDDKDIKSKLTDNYPMRWAECIENLIDALK